MFMRTKEETGHAMLEDDADAQKQEREIRQMNKSKTERPIGLWVEWPARLSFQFPPSTQIQKCCLLWSKTTQSTEAIATANRSRRRHLLEVRSDQYELTTFISVIRFLLCEEKVCVCVLSFTRDMIIEDFGPASATDFILETSGNAAQSRGVSQPQQRSSHGDF
jgi:hypothetical protein